MTAAKKQSVDLEPAPKEQSDDQVPSSGSGRKNAAGSSERLDEAGATTAPTVQVAKPTPAINRQNNRDAVQRLRHERARRLALRMAMFVVLPTLLASIYYGALASDQYESYAQFTVHSVESRGAGVEGILGGLMGPTSHDTLVVRDYILSRDMLARLVEHNEYATHWKSRDIDFIARLPADATFEDQYSHYEDQVELVFNSSSGVLTLRVRAVTPSKAKELALAIIERSESMVNELSTRERRDRTRDAEEFLAKMEQRLGSARQALLAQQQLHADLNPEQSAGASMTLRSGLEAELARARAHLMELRSFMTADAPKVRVAQERVKALSAQIGAEKARLIAPDGKGGIATSMADFEAAMVEKEFAEAAYRSALASLELARADAARQHRYLAVIAPASTPDEATYPERGFGILTFFILSFLFMGIGSLLVASVREHARV